MDNSSADFRSSSRPNLYSKHREINLVQKSREPENFGKASFETSLIDSRRDRDNFRGFDVIRNREENSGGCRMGMGQKPYVGITAETRFRRSHTLDMIRSTKMPVNDQKLGTEPTESIKLKHHNNNNQQQFHQINPKLVARF